MVRDLSHGRIPCDIMTTCFLADRRSVLPCIGDRPVVHLPVKLPDQPKEAKGKSTYQEKETAGRERQNPRRIFHRHDQSGNHIQHTGSPPVGRRRNSRGILPSLFRGFFLIPVAFISAELATGWPPKGPGGTYICVREALGERWGFVAIWMQWSENVIWFPTVLSFIGATIAYIFMPSLADNKLYMLTTILFIYWAGTFANSHGIKTWAWISTLGVIGHHGQYVSDHRPGNRVAGFRQSVAGRSVPACHAAGPDQPESPGFPCGRDGDHIRHRSFSGP